MKIFIVTTQTSPQIISYTSVVYCKLHNSGDLLIILTQTMQLIRLYTLDIQMKVSTLVYEVDSL